MSSGAQVMLSKDFEGVSASQSTVSQNITPPTVPLSFRLTSSEKEILKMMAGNMSLSAYVRKRLFDCADIAPRKRVRKPKLDDKRLGMLLGALGQSRLSSNLNQIAKAANMGALPVTDDLQGELFQACADVREMRAILIRALNIKAED